MFYLTREARWLLLGTSVVLAGCAIGAKAEDQDTRWVRKSLWTSCEWWETCRVKRSYRWIHRHHAHRTHRDFRTITLHSSRNDRYNYRSDGLPACHSPVIRVGEERYGRDRAKESAEQQWMEEVRNRYGVRYMDTRNARRATYECGRSSTGNRASEKTNEVVGRYLEQCTLEAQPCRGEKEGKSD